mmetsp:Transcript_52268/g.108843  ORF Transcript_52268/g.108843 Transcript_52268/m.108843 type:complete len:167 (-) Transcript_52268:67-567(-)
MGTPTRSALVPNSARRLGIKAVRRKAAGGQPFRWARLKEAAVIARAKVAERAKARKLHGKAKAVRAAAIEIFQHWQPPKVSKMAHCRRIFPAQSEDSDCLRSVPPPPLPVPEPPSMTALPRQRTAAKPIQMLQSVVHSFMSSKFLGGKGLCDCPELMCREKRGSMM